MNKELKKKRKQILSDPFRFFTSLHADTDSQLITRLENLSQQHKDLKSRYKEAQLRKNIISRQIGEARHNGYRWFNFGRSTKNTGTFRFKQQWGAREKPLYYHYWLGSSNELPGHSPSNPKYAMAISTWKHLPVPVTRWLGPLIVNKLP
jgi:hypothetical protein